MALQYSIAVNNARLDAIEAAIGASAILRVRTGAPPANCAAADSGTILASCPLPSDWMSAASGGAKAKNGTWDDPVANNTGTAGHWRIYDSTGTVCHMQGTFGTSGTDMIGDSVSFTAGQAFSITAFTLTAANT